jgi:hypothetical protein
MQMRHTIPILPHHITPQPLIPSFNHHGKEANKTGGPGFKIPVYAARFFRFGGEAGLEAFRDVVGVLGDGY